MTKTRVVPSGADSAITAQPTIDTMVRRWLLLEVRPVGHGASDTVVVGAQRVKWFGEIGDATA